MSATYVPASIYHTAIVVPSPGDPASAASVNTTALKFLADTSAFLKDVLIGQTFQPLTGFDAWDDIEPPVATGFAFNSIGILGQAVINRFTRIATIVPGCQGEILVPQALVASGAVSFTFDNSAGLGGYKYTQTDVSTTGSLIIPLVFPAGPAEITNVSVTVRGDISGGGAHLFLPGTLPTLSLIQQQLAGAPATNLGSVVDNSTSINGYENVHTLSLQLGTPQVLDPLSQYYALITGEAGANAVTDAFGVFVIRTYLAAPVV